jgi:hypothetical protein
METPFRARWISRDRADRLKRSGRLGQAILLDTFNGFLIVEPEDSKLGDGQTLSREEANYELQEVWYTGPRPRLLEARRCLGLDAKATAAQLSASGA